MPTPAARADAALRLFIPITKVDVAQRLVYGKATDESPDRSGEICDYASSKPYFEAWSGEIAKNTNGKSYGNVRAMHGKTAAGKLTAINFNDAEKAIEVCAKVVDDAEWEKVLEGVYTGFSQGGRYVKRWADADNPGLTRFTAEPMEISLVDLPCLPTATFQVIKAAGESESGEPLVTLEERHFKSVEPVEKTEESEPEQAEVTGELIALAKANPEGPKLRQFWECGCEGADHEHKTLKAANACMRKRKAEEAVKAAAAPVSEALDALAGLVAVEKSADPFPLHWSADTIDEAAKVAGGDEAAKRAFNTDERRKAAASGSAMPDGSFPIENKQDLENAIHAFGRAKDPTAAKKHIMARAKALGCPECVPDDWTKKMAAKEAALADLAKYAGEECDDSARAVSILSSLHDLLASEGYEADQGGEQPEQAGHLRSAIGHVKEFVASEIKENHDDGDPVKPMEMALGRLADLAKAGRRNSAADQARLQKCHDLMKEMGAECGSTASKAAEANAEALEKALAENAAFREEIAKIAPAVQSLTAEVAKFRTAPAPARAAVNALGTTQAGLAVNSQNAASVTLELLGKLTPEQRADVLMKDALAHPMPYGR